jgi:plasmid replication initiation protein
MREIMEINDRSLVIQHNDVVRARYKLSLEEQRLMKVLISMLKDDDEEGKTYFIRAADIAEVLELKGENVYHTLKQVTARLLKQVLFIRRDGGGELQVSWLSSAEYLKGGIIELEVSKKLRPYLLQLREHYTKYQLRQIAKLKSGFSIRVYELCKSHQYQGGFTIEVDEIKKRFGVDDKYKLYGDFKRKVLNVAKEEINKNTDILIEMFEEKKGKKVVAIRFSVESRDFETSKSEPEIAETADKRPDNPIIARLVGLGVVPKVAEELVGEFSEEYILAKIAYSEAQLKEGKVKNLPGFTVEAIRNGYRDNKAEEREREEEAVRLGADREARRKDWERMKARWSAWRAEQVEAHIAAMDAETREREKAAWLASIADNFAMMNLVRKSRENEERHFRIYLAGKADSLGLPEWARAVGADLSPFAEFTRLEQL